MLAETTSSGATSTLLRGALGSTIALTDSTGAITESYSYDPFGQTTAAPGDTNLIRYTGLPSGPGLPNGLQYNRARFYSPGAQRFISQDPIGFSGGTTDLYRYADADPVDNTDPSGQFVQFLVACGVGGLINDIGGYLAGTKHAVGDYIKGGLRGCAGGVLAMAAPELLGAGWEALSARFLAAEEGASPVLFDTNAIFRFNAAQDLLGEGEAPVITDTIEQEIADVAARPSNPFTGSIPDWVGKIAEDSGIGNRMLALWYLRGVGAAEQGIYGDAAIAATAVAQGIPVITGDEALYWAIKLLGGEARFLAP